MTQPRASVAGRPPPGTPIRIVHRNGPRPAPGEEMAAGAGGASANGADGAEPQPWTLRRTGAGPLLFHGVLLLAETTRAPGLETWHDLKLIELPDGRLALSLARRRAGREEPEHSLALLLPSVDAVLAALRAYDPLQGLPADQGRRADRRAAADRFRGLMAQLFGESPGLEGVDYAVA